MNLRPDRFTGKFYQAFKELILTVFKNFQKTEEELRLPSSFSETSTTLIPTADNENTNKRTTVQYL